MMSVGAFEHKMMKDLKEGKKIDSNDYNIALRLFNRGKPESEDLEPG